MAIFQSEDRLYNDDRGAVLAELVVTLPVFIAILFFIYWTFLALSWRDSIAVAVYNAVDIAETRGNPYLMGLAPSDIYNLENYPSILPALDEYKRVGTWNGAALGTATNAGLLASGNTGTIDPLSFYNSYMSKQGWSGSLSSVPRETLYAMGFAYSFLRSSLPPNVRYPCDPDVDTAGNGAGCLVCTIATAQDMHYPGTVMPSDRFGIECRYQPEHALLAPLKALLKIVTTKTTVLSHSRTVLDGSYSPQ